MEGMAEESIAGVKKGVAMYIDNEQKKVTTIDSSQPILEDKYGWIRTLNNNVKNKLYFSAK